MARSPLPLLLPVDVEGIEARDTENLIELTRTAPERLRVAAGCALADRGDPRAWEVLGPALSKPRVRYAALDGLRRLKDPRALEPAVRLLKKRFLDRFERTLAAGLVASLGEEAGRAHLIERLRARRRDDDRGLAIELCAELELVEAVPELERSAADSTDTYRGAAWRALATLAPEQTRPRLVALVADEGDDPDVRMDALEALVDLGGESARVALQSAMGSRNAELSDLAAHLLHGGAEAGGPEPRD